jgi:hypothetical protein
MLKTLQDNWQQALTDPQQTSNLLQHIKSAGKLSPDARFKIYQNGMQAGLVNCLSSTYAVTQQIVGENFFQAMAKRYVQANPSRNHSLFTYGADFAAFVATFPAAKSLPYLADVCRLEWAWQQAYYAPPAVPCDFQQLAELATAEQDNLIWQLAPSVSLIESAYPLEQIWRMHHTPESAQQTVQLEAGGGYVAVWRPQHQVLVHSIDAPYVSILQQFTKPTTHLPQSVEALQCIAICMQQGWLTYQPA